MKFFCTILPYYLAVVSSTVIELHSNRDGGFDLNYRRVGQSGGPLTASLFYAPDPREPLRREDDGEYLNITTVDNEHIYTRNMLHPLGPFVYMGFRSVFATEFARTYMLIARNRQLVIDPENPHELVYGGILATTHSTCDFYPQVRVSVSLVNTTLIDQDVQYVPPLSAVLLQSTPIHDFVFDTLSSKKDVVPSSIIQALFDELRQREIPCEPEYGPGGTIRTFAIPGDLSEDVIPSFPIIQYRIHTDSGNDVYIQLNGRDYIGAWDGHQRPLLLLSGREYAFGWNTLSMVALYIDNRGRTIGFGEPL